MKIMEQDPLVTQADTEEPEVVEVVVVSNEGDKIRKQRRLLQELKARKRKNSYPSSVFFLKIGRVEQGSSIPFKNVATNISSKDCSTVSNTHKVVDHNYSSAVNKPINKDQQAAETHKRESNGGNSRSGPVLAENAVQLNKALSNPVGNSVLTFVLQKHLNSVGDNGQTIVGNKNSIPATPTGQVQSDGNNQHNSSEITTINDDEALLNSLTTTSQTTNVEPQTSNVKFVSNSIQSHASSIIVIDDDVLENNKKSSENVSRADNNPLSTPSLLTHDLSTNNHGKRFPNLRYFSSKGYRTVSAMLKSWETILKSANMLPNKNWFHNVTSSQTQDKILNIYELESKFSGGMFISRSIQIYPQGAFAVSIDSKLCTDSFVTDRGIQSFDDLTQLVLKVSRHKLCKGCDGFENVSIVDPAVEGVREGDKWYSANCLKTIEVSESSTSRCIACAVVLQKLQKLDNNRNIKFGSNCSASNRRNYVIEEGKLDLGKTIYSLMGDIYQDLKLHEHASTFRALPANAKR